MPARHFDGRRLRAARRAADLSQMDIARAMGFTSTGTVAAWEGGSKRPAPEKLPALARALGSDLEVLFPRGGPPDLADLRCDAGYTQAQTRTIMRTRSAGPVAYAERGQRPLPQRFVEPLAHAYGVSVEQVLAAQARSMGKVVPEEGRPLSAAVAHKISNLLSAGGGQKTAPRTDEEIARAVNKAAGGQVVTAAEIAAMRTGEAGHLSPPVLDGLAAAFGIPPRSLRPDEEAVREIAQELQAIAELRGRPGPISHLAARGAGGQLSPRVVAAITDLLEEIEEGGLPGSSDFTELD
ncbi:transcriptional regulator with XRE-family HTH domain [Streptomyces zagrosensis]|uniref:Transcriptional regulator with XRE-family HTH domain n=2 Tax=Streptomyces zagrosensis TaxID=1042984 RepID=A0A7W9V2A9_9ACTN|nr:transcriptional regulator with XRE-family HTH domain [Streptomyces zagrosensis]